jgi:hypothetical protein
MAVLPQRPSALCKGARVGLILDHMGSFLVGMRAFCEQVSPVAARSIAAVAKAQNVWVCVELPESEAARRCSVSRRASRTELILFELMTVEGVHELPR